MAKYSELMEKLLGEDIKGWKHAHNDLMKMRSKKIESAKSIKLVALKKDGSESKMYDAVKKFNNIDEVDEYIKRIGELNPGRSFSWNLYIDNNLEKRVDI